MFENIIGNNKIKNLLENSIKQGNVSHSYLFIGIDGIGKKLKGNKDKLEKFTNRYLKDLEVII